MATRIPLAFRRGPRRKQKAIELVNNWHIFRGDVVRSAWRSGRSKRRRSRVADRVLVPIQVEVINGPHKGKQGQVVSVVREQNKLIVENLNMVRVGVAGWGMKLRETES
jgi:ribosomal protein L24